MGSMGVIQGFVFEAERACVAVRGSWRRRQLEKLEGVVCMVCYERDSEGVAPQTSLLITV